MNVVSFDKKRAENCLWFAIPGLDTSRVRRRWQWATANRKLFL